MLQTKVNFTKDLTIDFDIPTLLVSTDQDIIILTTGDHTPGSFTGMIIWENGSDWKVGEYDNNWDKSDFQIFKGDITLNNL